MGLFWIAVSATSIAVTMTVVREPRIEGEDVKFFVK
jgi:hypothetical protein